MNPRETRRSVARNAIPAANWTIFPTEIGWIGVAQCPHGVLRVSIGHRTEQDLVAALPADAATSSRADALTDRIQDYCTGARDDFLDVAIAATWSTPFQRAVIATLRQVRYGQTTSYGELAQRAKRPGAARAVGQVMATNPVPLIVPCHRVLGSGGKLGGFSAPTGLNLKRQLLQIEAAGAGLQSVPEADVVKGSRR